MSASETNVKKQAKRHRGPLIGMIVVLIFALGLFVWWLMHEAADGAAPQGAPATVDGRTGDVQIEGTGSAADQPSTGATPQGTPAPAN